MNYTVDPQERGTVKADEVKWSSDQKKKTSLNRFKLTRGREEDFFPTAPTSPPWMNGRTFLLPFILKPGRTLTEKTHRLFYLLYGT